MKQEYRLEGLDCAHCASKIEAAVGKLEGVRSVRLNFLNKTLTLDAHTDLTHDIEALVQRMEPGVQVCPCGKKEPVGESSLWFPVLRLVLSGLLFGLSLIPSAFSLVLTLIAYGIAGYDVLWKAVRNLFRGKMLDENCLMGIATVGAFAIGEYPEAVAVMLFYQLGELFQGLAVRRSRKSVAQLMDIRPDFARVQTSCGFEPVVPESVAVGQLIQILPGERIPLDAVVTEGQSLLDTRALTGEAVPRNVRPGDELISGCINLEGILTATVTKPASESTVTRILTLVEDAAARKAPAEHFITRFAKFYTPAVVALALLIGIVPPLFFGQSFLTWIHRSFVFLVVSCPCALVISVPLAYFGGIGAASHHGILVKGGNYLDALTRLDTVVFDKTGTLTHGEFQVQKVLTADHASKEQVLSVAAVCERYSGHPIARSICAACDELPKEEPEHYKEHSGRGISAIFRGKQVLCGNEALLKEHGISFPICKDAGTKVYVAVDGRYMGCILIADRIRQESVLAIRELKKLGIGKTIMLTGDEKTTAAAVADALGMDGYAAGLLPHEKVEKLEQLMDGSKVAFVGDGINDAPSLGRADVGVAMGAFGSQAAMEAADVVLMTDDPSKLAQAIKIAHSTRSIVTQNIVLALSIKAVCLVLGALGLTGMWTAVFADVGVSLLAILNSLRMIRK